MKSGLAEEQRTKVPERVPKTPYNEALTRGDEHKARCPRTDTSLMWQNRRSSGKVDAPDRSHIEALKSSMYRPDRPGYSIIDWLIEWLLFEVMSGPRFGDCLQGLTETINRKSMCNISEFRILFLSTGRIGHEGRLFL
jgi:hypothetical protein